MAERKCNGLKQRAANALKTITSDKVKAVKAAIRTSMDAKGATVESTFTDIAKGKNITQDAFNKYLGSLPDSKFSDDQKKLVFQHISGGSEGGIDKEAFSNLLAVFCI